MPGGLIPGYYNLPEDLVAPSGTRCMFHQSSMPLGWASDPNNFADYAVRLVTSAGGANTGSVNFSTFNNGGTIAGNTFTISVAQMAAHNHGISSSHSHTCSDGHQAVVSGGSTWPGSVQTGAFNTLGVGNTASATTGVTLNNNGSGTAVSWNMLTPNVKFADFGIGVKS